MALQISISNAIGARAVAGGGGVDPDAQAFITAAAITDPTQQAAINTLVVDLKGYSIWNKMKAIYPIVGGTAATHKWNLKDPRDLDAAFRLVFSGGYTHNNLGITGNGTNAYADTKLIPNSGALTQNSTHISVYSRTNKSNSNECLIGSATAAFSNNGLLILAYANDPYIMVNNSTLTNGTGFNTTGLLTATRTTSTNQKLFRNTSTLINATSNSTGLSNGRILLNAFVENNISISRYAPHNLAFASIGQGLTDTEAANFYTAVQAFQTTLGRSIGTQTVSDADAQAFVTNAGIVDQVEADAINNLVIGLKADSLWSKMKALYPFCGGSASSHKFNLKDPRDLDAAFRLVFSGGVTHSSTGATFNGTNGFADTKLASNGVLAQNSTHFSAYSRTNNQSGGYIVANGNANASGECKIFARWFDNNCYTGVNTFGQVATANSDSRGYFIVNRISATQHSVVIRGTKTDFNTNSSGLNTNTFRICSAINTAYDNKEVGFASIGDGLTATELGNLNSRVTTFQTALNRNV
jgi:hypothetical protein